MVVFVLALTTVMSGCGGDSAPTTAEPASTLEAQDVEPVEAPAAGDSEETLADVVRGSAEAAEVRVVIGRENDCRGMSRMSLVAGTYRIGGSVARMGIIGPTRMRYPRLIGLVGYFSKVLDDLLAE